MVEITGYLKSRGKLSYSIFFENSNTGWAVGDTGTVLKTTDGGNEWNDQTSGTTKVFINLFPNTVSWNAGWKCRNNS